MKILYTLYVEIMICVNGYIANYVNDSFYAVELHEKNLKIYPFKMPMKTKVFQY